MKKVIALLLVAITLVSLCACGKSAKKETISADEAIENSVVREARGYVVINYENVKNVFTTVTSTRSNDDGPYRAFQSRWPFWPGACFRRCRR